MKKIFAVVLFAALTSAFGLAQKFAYVDTEYILGNIPAYKAAQEQIDKLSADWQKEVEAKYADIDKLYKNFQSEKVLLTEDMKNKREEDIVKKEQEVKDLQKKYFGRDGLLFKKRQELIKPIQDEVYNAVKQLAQEQGFAIIFDTASNQGIVYSNPKNDKSDEILQRLGYKN
ncbi:MAG: OmpH family outer membrane protein [Bacteroidota bacterium]|nr:OmpH family outer membrane protein [Bacteroidota bacterium]